jgi:hypothetical protein
MTTIPEKHPVRNFLILAGATLALATGAMQYAARAECNCQSGQHVDGGFGEPRTQAQRDAFQAKLTAAWNQAPTVTGIPVLSPEEKARWNTVGTYLYSKQVYTTGVFGWVARTWAGSVWSTDQYNTWGGRVNGKGYGGWSW